MSFLVAVLVFDINSVWHAYTKELISFVKTVQENYLVKAFFYTILPFERITNEDLACMFLFHFHIIRKTSELIKVRPAL